MGFFFYVGGYAERNTASDRMALADVRPTLASVRTVPASTGPVCHSEQGRVGQVTK